MKKGIVLTLLLSFLITVPAMAGEINNIKVGDIVNFGKYEQDNNLDNGQEPIEWEVLEVREGKALLLSRYALDYRGFNDEDVPEVFWENCTLRAWLNQEFFSSAFTDAEKAMIEETIVVNNDGSNDTKDYIFVFDLGEIEKYFEIGPDKWRQENESLVCRVTEYGRARYIPALAEHDEITVEEAEEALRGEEDLFGYGMTYWWLRSSDGYNVDGIRYDGRVVGGSMYDSFLGVRPALWINVE